ncbi:uncharacterized protein LOC111120855 isoform X2 [Crassostrea virginica]
MSRHRNVRTMNYEDEYYDEDEVYGHSYDDSYCVSPATAAQFTFNRERDINLSSYMEEGIPEEEDESDPEGLSDSGRDNFKLDDVEQAKLNSCKEEIVNVIGDTIPEHIVSQAVVRNHYNIQATLNELLNQNEAPKPQRQPRTDRRANRQDEDDDFDNFLESLEADSGEIIFSNQMKLSPHILKFGSSPKVDNIPKDKQVSFAPSLQCTSDKDRCENEPTKTLAQFAVEKKVPNQVVQGQKTCHVNNFCVEGMKEISHADLRLHQKSSSPNIIASAKAAVSLGQLAAQQKSSSSALKQNMSVSSSGSSLAQLAAKQQGSTGVKEKKMSLAELAAKQKESSCKVLTKPPGVSLADLAAKNSQGTVDKKGPSSGQSLKVSKDSTQSKPVEKSETTSLALLAKRHKETSESMKGNMSTTPLAHLALKNKAAATTSLSSEKNEQGLSLAQLAGKQKMSIKFAPVQPTVQLKTPVKKTATSDIAKATSAASQIRLESSPSRGVSDSQPVSKTVKNAIAKTERDSRTGAVNLSVNNEEDFTDSDSRNLTESKVKAVNPEIDLVGDLMGRDPEIARVTSSGIPATPKSTSKVKQDKARLKEELERRKTGKDLLNLVVIGHVDAGKSTLMGHLLYQMGVVNKRAMHKYEQESKKRGKGSFAFAWVLDETEEERSRGVTMDIAQTAFETLHKQITLLDAPGHKDFIPNMITGTAQADVAILVVNATRGEFETGFESGGQTREHALLARSLGVSQLLVAINKMDTVNWSQTRYDDIVVKLGTFLKQAGYKDSDVSYIPCSGLGGENLTKAVTEPKLAEWYKGSTLLEQIDKFKPVERSMDRPFRLIISDVFKGLGSGFSVVGRVSSGSVQAGDKVLVQPAGDLAVVKAVTMEDSDNSCGFAGDHVTIILTGMDMAHVNVGSAICDPQNPIKSAMRIRARIVIFNLELPITKGFTVVFHYQSITEPAIIKRLNCQLNKNTGEVIKNKPKCLVKNSSAVVEIEFDRPVCLEMYKEYKDLGRFMLRHGGHTIAAGLVEEVLKTKSKTEENSTE